MEITGYHTLEELHIDVRDETVWVGMTAVEPPRTLTCTPPPPSPPHRIPVVSTCFAITSCASSIRVALLIIYEVIVQPPNSNFRTEHCLSLR